MENTGTKSKKKPRILIVTPEATYLPDQLGSISDCLSAKAGGLADVTASLICELFRRGVDVHAAIPNYRAIYEECLAVHLQKSRKSMRYVLPGDRLHLAEDRIFFHRDRIYSGIGDDNLSLALVFQREVINNIIPRVAPDLIHCHDWMTGLIPAMARKTGSGPERLDSLMAKQAKRQKSCLEAKRHQTPPSQAKLDGR